MDSTQDHSNKNNLEAGVRKMFFKIGVFKNFAIFTENIRVLKSLFLVKLQSSDQQLY